MRVLNMDMDIVDLVIYPCLNIDSIPFIKDKWDYYFYNWRCIPYKKFDLIVDAFNLLTVFLLGK